MSDHPVKTEAEIDEISGVETTGHEWDGIKELNNPMPRWWLWTFYATIVWAIAYMVAYPAIPLINGATEGLLGWSSRADLREQVSLAADAQAERLQAIETNDLATIAADADLRQFAINGGRSAFKVYCVQCHGSGAAGGPGYPNLNDDDWIWGGSLEEIYLTLAHGVRHEADEDTRFAEMPAFGRDELMSREDISDVAWFVRQLSNQEADTEAALRGAVGYEENCAACHGEKGEGDRETGSPSLADAIWLYGSEHAEIVTQINLPKHGVMPAWAGRLDDKVLKQLTVYVHGLGGGE